MTELYPTDTELDNLSGTTDAEQEVAFLTVGESPYYTSFYKMLQRLLNVARRAGDLRVFKDGDLTFGVRAGKFLNGDTLIEYAPSTGNALTNNAANYIYLTASGTLTVNTTGFPVPSATPHLRLAMILASGGTYDGRIVANGGDVIDYRGTCIYGVTDAEARAFFAATDITGAEAETLTDTSNADALHVHAAAGLESGLADMIPQIVFAGSDHGGGTGLMDIQVADAAGNNLAERFLIRTWIADADFSEPDPQTDFSVSTGEQMREIEADADYEVISDATGLVTMNIDAGGAKTLYVMAEIDGRIYSQSLAITT